MTVLLSDGSGSDRETGPGTARLHPVGEARYRVEDQLACQVLETGGGGGSSHTGTSPEGPARAFSFKDTGTTCTMLAPEEGLTFIAGTFITAKSLVESP